MPKPATKRKQRNAGAFDRCVRSVAARGNVRDPRGVCAAAGRKKYGAKKFAAMAAAGRRKAAKKRNAGKRSAVPARVLAGYKRIWGGTIPPGAREQLEREYQRAKDAKKGRKKNPARRRRNDDSAAVDSAAQRYEHFHGKEPGEVFEFEETVEVPTVFSGIGRLKSIDVQRIDGRGVTQIQFDRDTLLAQDKRRQPGKRQQLYIVGGDQSVNLSDFGISRPHEYEMLGAVEDIVYHTEKVHLRPEDGGRANYDHEFAKKRIGEKHIPIRSGRLPQLKYDVRNKLLEIVGGTYDLPEVGIRG